MWYFGKNEWQAECIVQCAILHYLMFRTVICSRVKLQQENCNIATMEKVLHLRHIAIRTRVLHGLIMYGNIRPVLSLPLQLLPCKNLS